MSVCYTSQSGKTLPTITISVEGLLWIFLTVATIFLRLWDLGARVMSHDESLHVYYSWLLATGNGFAHNPMMHGPFLFEATAFLNVIFGANDFTSRLVPVLLGSFVAIGIPLLLRPWLGRVGALMTALLLSISPYLLFYSRYDRHDIQVIAWVLLAFVAIVGYLRSHAERYLLLLSASLALMFATMEIAFIYLAIFTGFMLLVILYRYGVNWSRIHTSAEFDVVIVMVTLGAFFSSPIALLGINPIWQKLTGQPFVAMTVLSSYGIEWSKGPDGLKLWGLLGIFSVGAMVVGWLWGKTRWFKMAALFLGISLTLFTTFFTNPAGVGTGLIGSLGYWLAQHGVQRGSQPWFYYLLVFPLYEYAPILIGSASLVFFTLRQRWMMRETRFFVSIIIFWAFTMWYALSLAGEKMPWLSTHLTVPWILLAGWGLGQFLPAVFKGSGARREAVVRWGGAAAVLLLLVLTLRTSTLVNYRNYDYTTEPIGYAHGAPGAKWAAEDIARLAKETGKGNSLVVAYDDQVSWPMTWYFRNYPGFFGANLTPEAISNADVVVVGQDKWQKADRWLGSNYQRYEVIRMWWPIEDYKNLTFQKIGSDLQNPQMRMALWNILWNRDYTAYATLTQQNQIDPPRQWPLQDRMRIYIKTDLAKELPPVQLAGSKLEDLPALVDTYKDLRLPNKPVRVLTNLGLSSPRNLSISKDGSLYVVDTGNSRILKINQEGQTLQVIGARTPDGQTPPAPGTFNEPWGMAVDGTGNLYIADTWNHRIQKFDARGNFLLEWGSGGVSSENPDLFWGPRAIAIGNDKRVYITDTGNRRVAVYDEAGKFLFNFEQGGEAALNEPVGLVIHEEHVYVADTWNQRIVAFDLEGHYGSNWTVQAWNSTSLDNKPYITVDQTGNIYATDPEGSRVIEFAPDGRPLTVLGQSENAPDRFMIPNGMAMDSQGQIWVTDAGNQQILAYPTDKKAASAP